MSAQSSKGKPRLGRGLSSLISMSDLPVEAELDQPLGTVPPAPVPVSNPTGTQSDPAQEVPVTPTAQPAIMREVPPLPQQRPGPVELPIDSIVANPHQPRRQFNDASIAALAASIKSTGLVQPVIVRRVADGLEQYQLVAGERRWRAARQAGLTNIPAIVREVDSFKQAQMALVENIQREDLNPIERAQAYRTLMDQLGLTQQELAARIGEDRSSVANYLRLLELPAGVQELIRDGKLSLGHAKVLAGMTEKSRQEELAKRVAEEGMSVRNLERVLEALATQPAAVAEKDKKVPPSAHMKDLERTMTSQIGMRVVLKTSSQKGKGKVVIHYSSLDEFDQLLDKLGVKTE